MTIYSFDVLLFLFGTSLLFQVQSEMQYLNAVSKRQNDLCSFPRQTIQINAPISNAEKAEVEWFYKDLQDLLELTPKKDVLFIIGDWNAKAGSQEIPGVQATLALEYKMKQGKG